jgi:SAM-dependent methyltransferase
LVARTQVERNALSARVETSHGTPVGHGSESQHDDVNLKGGKMGYSLPAERRTTFDAVATTYDRSRPGYPEELFDDVIAYATIPDGGRILEIGPGTGHATLPFAERGYWIDAFELGDNLAQRWQANLSDYPNATIQIGPFEEAELPESAYDLAIAATAFHWIDPDIGFPKVGRVLKANGTIALWWNRHIETPDDGGFFVATRPLYEQWAPHLIEEDTEPPAPDQVPSPVGDRIGRSGWFGPVTERRYHWTRTFDTESYIGLLESYSRYRVLEPTIRDGLYADLHRLIESDFGGSVTKGFLTLLYLAKRLPHPPAPST